MATTGVRNVEIHAPKLVALERVEIDVMVYGHAVGPHQIVNRMCLYCGATIFSEEDGSLIVGVRQIVQGAYTSRRR